MSNPERTHIDHQIGNTPKVYWHRSSVVRIDESNLRFRVTTPLYDHKTHGRAEIPEILNFDFEIAGIHNPTLAREFVAMCELSLIPPDKLDFVLGEFTYNANGRVPGSITEIFLFARDPEQVSSRDIEIQEALQCKPDFGITTVLMTKTLSYDFPSLQEFFEDILKSPRQDIASEAIGAFVEMYQTARDINQNMGERIAEEILRKGNVPLAYNEMGKVVEASVHTTMPDTFTFADKGFYAILEAANKFYFLLNKAQQQPITFLAYTFENQQILTPFDAKTLQAIYKQYRADIQNGAKNYIRQVLEFSQGRKPKSRRRFAKVLMKGQLPIDAYLDEDKAMRGDPHTNREKEIIINGEKIDIQLLAVCPFFEGNRER